MAGLVRDSVNIPEETRPFEDRTGQLELVDLANGPVGRERFEPARQGSKHVKPRFQIPHRHVRRALIAVIGAGTLGALASFALSGGAAHPTPAVRQATTASAADPQAMFAILTQLPSDDVNVIVPGLTPQVRDDLNAITHAVAGSMQH
jgi:hypothetical protein